jgi:hypothetical protein
MSQQPKSRAELIAELQRQPKPNLGAAPAKGNPGVIGRQANHGFSDLEQPLDGGDRFQYAIVNIGTFNNAERMQTILGRAGAAGWELVTVYDKSSNWIGGWEKGFMLLKRPVPLGTRPSSWCLMIRS